MMASIFVMIVCKSSELHSRESQLTLIPSHTPSSRPATKNPMQASGSAHCSHSSPLYEPCSTTKLKLPNNHLLRRVARDRAPESRVQCSRAIRPSYLQLSG